MAALDTRAGSRAAPDDHTTDLRPADPAADARDPDVTPGATPPSWIRRWWPLLTMIAIAMAMSVVVRRTIYPAFSWNRDEVTYLWQVSVLRGHHLFGADGGFPNFFQPWLTGANEHGFFSQYTIGWPAVMLVADVLFDNSAVAILVGVVALVAGTYAITRELTRDHTLALITTALVVVCPFFVVQSGVYLGYLFSTGVGLLFGASLLSGLRRDDWRRLVLAGALLGVILLTRPFDAVLWAAVFAIYAVIAAFGREEAGRWRVLVRGALITGLVFLPFVVLTLAYNRAVTGSFTQFPFTAKEPLDTFGFGERRLLPHTPITSFSGTESVRGELRNAFYFPQFLVGAWLGVAVAIVGLWMRRRQRSTFAILGLLAVFPVGYSMFWGIRLSSYYAFLSAPLYFLPAYVPCCILIGTVILAVWRARRAWSIALCAALLVVTAPFLVSRLRSNHALSQSQEPWRTAAESIHRDSLVFVASADHYLLHLNPFSRNTPVLDGLVLYATDQPTDMLDLIAAHPGRQPLLEVTSNPKLADAFHHPNPEVPDVTLVPLSVLRGRQFLVTARYTAPHAGALVASLRVGATSVTRTLADDATPGAVYETSWRVGDAAAGAADAAVVPLPAPKGRFEVRVAMPADVAAPFAARHQLQRWSYRTVDGVTEVLNPSRRLVMRHVDGELVSREVLRFSNYAVELVGNS
jgi:hypothetical protein